MKIGKRRIVDSVVALECPLSRLVVTIALLELVDFIGDRVTGCFLFRVLPLQEGHDEETATQTRLALPQGPDPAYRAPTCRTIAG